MPSDVTTQTDFNTTHEDYLRQLEKTLEQGLESYREIFAKVHNKYLQLKKIPFEEVRFELRLCTQLAWACAFNKAETAQTLNMQQYYLEHFPNDREVIEQKLKLCGQTEILEATAEGLSLELVPVCNEKETQANLPPKEKVTSAVIRQDRDGINYLDNFTKLQHTFQRLSLLTDQDKPKSKMKQFDAFADDLIRLVYQIKKAYPLKSCQHIDINSHPVFQALNFAVEAQALYISFLKKYNQNMLKLSDTLQQRAFFLSTLAAYYEKSNAPEELLDSVQQRAEAAEFQFVNIKGFSACDNVIAADVTSPIEKLRAEQAQATIAHTQEVGLKEVDLSFKAAFGFESLPKSQWPSQNRLLKDELDDINASYPQAPFAPYLQKVAMYVSHILAVMAPQQDTTRPYIQFVDGDNNLHLYEPFDVSNISRTAEDNASDATLPDKETLLTALTLYFQARIGELNQRITWGFIYNSYNLSCIQQEITFCQLRLNTYQFLLGERAPLTVSQTQASLKQIQCEPHVSPLIHALASTEQAAIIQEAQAQLSSTILSAEAPTEVSKKYPKRKKSSKKSPAKPATKVIEPQQTPPSSMSKKLDLMEAVNSELYDEALILAAEWVQLLKQEENEEKERSQGEKTEQLLLIEENLNDAYMHRAIIQRNLAIIHNNQTYSDGASQSLDLAWQYLAPDTAEKQELRNHQIQQIKQHQWLIYSQLGYIDLANDAREVAQTHAIKNDSFCFVIQSLTLSSIPMFDSVVYLQAILEEYRGLIDRMLDNDKPPVFVNSYDIPHFHFALKKLSTFLFLAGTQTIKSGIGQGKHDVVEEGIALINKSLDLDYKLLNHSTMHAPEHRFVLELKLGTSFRTLQAILPPDDKRKKYLNKPYRLLAKEHYDEAHKIANRLNDAEKKALVKKEIAKLPSATKLSYQAIESSMGDTAQQNYFVECLNKRQIEEPLYVVEDIAAETELMMQKIEEHSKLEQVRNIIRVLEFFHGDDFIDSRIETNRENITTYRRELDALRIQLLYSIDNHHALIAHTHEVHQSEQGEANGTAPSDALVAHFNSEIQYFAKVLRIYKEQQAEEQLRLNPMNRGMKDKYQAQGDKVNELFLRLENFKNTNTHVQKLTEQECIEAQNSRVVIDLMPAELENLKQSRVLPGTFKNGITYLQDKTFWVALYQFYSGVKHSNKGLTQDRTQNAKIHYFMAKIMNWALSEMTESLYPQLQSREAQLYLHTAFTKMKGLCESEYRVAQGRGQKLFGRNYLVDDLRALAALSLPEISPVKEADHSEHNGSKAIAARML